MKILGHEPTIADLHKWMDETNSIYDWAQNSKEIYIKNKHGLSEKVLPYDSSESLLEQSDTIKEAILQLILGEYGN